MKNYIFLLLFFASCSSSGQNSPFAKVPKLKSNQEIAYFASGCFWCVEGVYEQILGVDEVISGYAGGKMKNPSYYNHGNHTETVLVIYNSQTVDYKQLLEVFFEITNPYTVGQEPDFGPSYRSAIFPKQGDQMDLVDQYLERYEEHKIDVIAFEKTNFSPAEEYHQNYVSRLEAGEKVVNPRYGVNVSIPRRNAFLEKTKFPLKN